MPLVDLDRKSFTTIGQFEQRVPGAISLQHAQSLTVRGDWTLADGMTVYGDAVLEADEPQALPAGAVVNAPTTK